MTPTEREQPGDSNWTRDRNDREQSWIARDRPS